METHEEADNILAQQMVYVVKETGKDVSVISDDTDVFALSVTVSLCSAGSNADRDYGVTRPRSCVS